MEGAKEEKQKEELKSLWIQSYNFLLVQLDTLESNIITLDLRLTPIMKSADTKVPAEAPLEESSEDFKPEILEKIDNASKQTEKMIKRVKNLIDRLVI